MRNPNTVKKVYDHITELKRLAPDFHGLDGWHDCLAWVLNIKDENPGGETE